MSKEEFDFTQAKQGALVPAAPTKTCITIRLDTDVLNWFRNQVHEAGGGNYQTLINEALRQYIHVQDDSLEETLRKVIREELQTLSQVEKTPTPQKNLLDFRQMFSDADTAFSRSISLEDLGDRFVESLTQSAISKCLDFNIQANRASDNIASSFFLVANARAICEDLIYVSCLRGLEKSQSEAIASKMHEVAHRKNVLAQTRFFGKNNTMQPTFGGLQSMDQQEIEIQKAEEELKTLWEQQGFSKKPLIRDVADRVGLKTTYDYLYHLSSNFVHFNPGQLLRTGWGSRDDTFTFSVHNFEGYFSDLARFLGLLLFLGYCYVAPEKFSEGFARKYIEHITSKLQSNFRWPEIITFEEMNQELPKNIIVRAMMSVLRESDPKALPDVLGELQSLQNIQG